jgi:hypothetical protein
MIRQPIALLVFLSITICQKSYSQSQTHRSQSIITNSAVQDIIYSNGYAMLRGPFYQAGDYSGSFIMVDDNAGTEDLSWPVISGSVNAALPDGNGGWYVGGYFYAVDNEDVGNLVHILPDKTLDRTWLPGTTGTIYSLAADNGILYVGGTFVTMAGQSRYHAAAFNMATGQLTSWDPHPNNHVTEIAVTANAVYLGGLFTKMNNATVDRNKLAAVNKTDGAILASWNVTLAGTTPAVETLTASATHLFIGGYFSSVNGTPRNGLAAVSLSDGALNTAWVPEPQMLTGNPRIYDLVLDGTTLYVGGIFNAGIGGDATLKHVAAVSTTGSGAPVASFKPQFVNTDQIRSINLDGNTLYVSGLFGSVNGLPRYGLAAISTTNGTPGAWNPDAVGSSVDVIIGDGERVLIGGDLIGINWSVHDGLMIIDESTGKFWPHQLEVGSAEQIEAMLVKDNTMYIGGQFTTVNGVSRKNLAAIDMLTGTVLPWNPGATESTATFDNTRVTALEINNNTIYIAGIFLKVGGLDRRGLAAVDATTGAVSAWNPGVGDGTSMDEFALSLDVHNNALYVAGNFGTLAGESRSFLGAVDLTSGNLVNWNPAVNDDIRKIRVSGNTAYVLGSFSGTIAGQVRPFGIAGIDINTGLATGWNPTFSSAGINDFTVTDTDIYVASYFETAEGDPRPGLASFSLASGALNPWNPDVGSAGEGNYDVQTVAASPNRLYIGGSFVMVGNEQRIGYAEYDLCSADATITLDGSTLVAPPADSYQWYENDLLMEGATGQTYEINVFEYGRYAVEVNSNGCTARSDDYVYLVTGRERESSATSQVYPNPSKNELWIEVDANSVVSILDFTGRAVRSTTVTPGTPNRIDTSGLPTGAYVVRILKNTSTESIKIVKQD